MDEILTRDKEIQTEAPLSGVIRVMNSKKHNRKVQVKFPASTAAWKRDPKIVQNKIMVLNILGAILGVFLGPEFPRN